jgi:hypothetical protein
MITGLVEGSHIYHAISKTNADSDAEVIVFGDSVGGQMYHTFDYSGRINSLCTAMPVTLAGQYLLLKAYSDRHPMNGKKVVMILTPQAFESEFDPNFSFHYFLKPFYNSGFKNDFDNYINESFSVRLVNSLSQFPLIKLSNWQPPYFVQYVQVPSKMEGLSNTSRIYLKKMIRLSNEQQFDLSIKPAILPDTKSGTSFKELQVAISQCGFSDIFDGYFENMKFLDRNLFKDGAHLINPKILPKNILNL